MPSLLASFLKCHSWRFSFRLPPVSGIGSNHQKNLTTTHRTSTQRSSSMQKDGNLAVSLESKFGSLKSFERAVMDWAIAMHFSTRTVKCDK